MSSVITAHLLESNRIKSALVEHAPQIEAIATTLERTVRQGGVIYVCGNGGSACDSMHFVEELVARYKMDRPGIKAKHLCDPAILTCWSNDYDFNSVFARQIETFVGPTDAVVCFTTSGNSPNILRALEVANNRQAATIGLLGKDGGKAKALAAQSVVVPSDVTAHIQEAHITIVHILCELLETRLFGGA